MGIVWLLVEGIKWWLCVLLLCGCEYRDLNGGCVRVLSRCEQWELNSVYGYCVVVSRWN
jgi:hypothetical protein